MIHSYDIQYPEGITSQYFPLPPTQHEIHWVCRPGMFEKGVHLLARNSGLQIFGIDVFGCFFEFFSATCWETVFVDWIIWYFMAFSETTWIWPQQYLVKTSIRQQPHLAGVYFAPWGWWNIRWDYCQYGHSNMATLHGKYDDSPVNIRFLIWCQFSRSVRPRSNDNYDHILWTWRHCGWWKALN